MLNIEAALEKYVYPVLDRFKPLAFISKDLFEKEANKYAEQNNLGFKIVLDGVKEESIKYTCTIEKRFAEIMEGG